MVGTLRVGLVENDKDYRDHLAGVLRDNSDLDRISLWSSGEEFCADESARDVELVLVDVDLPRMTGVELACQVAEQTPETKIVMLTATEPAEEVMMEALRAGVAGYLLKSEVKDLNETLRQILDGGAVLTPTIAQRLLRRLKKPAPSKNHSLTTRELQILKAMASGMAPRKTAEHFKLSEKTVRAHVRNIYRKLNVNNQIELMKKVHDLGLD